MMYIGEHCGAVKFNNANVSLMAAKEKGHRDTSTWEMQYGSTAEQLKNYTVTTVPPKDEWVTVAKGVKFRECVENENEEEGNGDNKKSLSKVRLAVSVALGCIFIDLTLLPPLPCRKLHSSSSPPQSIMVENSLTITSRLHLIGTLNRSGSPLTRLGICICASRRTLR